MCPYHASISSFFRFSLVKVIKHVKLIVKCELLSENVIKDRASVSKKKWGTSRASGPSMTYVLQKALFGISVTVYDKVGDGNKFLYENFGLGRFCFHVACHLKLETREFFSQILMPQCNS